MNLSTSLEILIVYLIFFENRGVEAWRYKRYKDVA